MSKTDKLSLAQFARACGQTVRMVEAAATPFHRHYLTLDTEGRKAMRSEWIVAHLQGQGYSAEDAAWINEASRTERAREDQRAYDCARDSFSYHVSRQSEERANKPEKPAIRARMVKSVADDAVNAIIAAGLSKAEFRAVLDAIKAGVQFK
jgi:hypothetical protein